MLAKPSGEVIREHQVSKGLSQVQLARNASVSRTVLSRLEQGKATAVQADVLDRLFDALGVQPSIGSAAPADNRRRARLEQQCKLERARSRHLRLAIELASDENLARPLVTKAKERVELWRQNKSCSPYYIDRWAKVLAQTPRDIAMDMASFGEWEDALLQNSPWSWVWT